MIKRLFRKLMAIASENGAIALSLDWAIYLIFIQPLDGNYYYALTGLINLLTGIVLFRKYIGAALCSFALIFVSYYGYIIWYNYQLPDSYDNMSICISIIQLLLIIPKGTYSYVNRCVKRSMVRTANFYGRNLCVRMYRYSKTQGKNQ